MTNPASNPLIALSDGLADAVQQAAASVVTVYGRRRLPASGIVWDTNTILTASHTVERDEDISIGLPDGTTVSATLAGRDHGSDIAVLTAELGETPVAHRATATARVGQIALAIGRAGSSNPRATVGAISTIGGAWRTINGNTVSGFVRAELTMLPGFSGGPLVSVAGELLGMNTSALGQDGGITLPVAAIEPIVSDLRAHGRLRRGYLGIASQTVELTENGRASIGVEQSRGLLIVHVEPNGPGETGGLLVGDILLTVDGHPVTDTGSLQERLGPESVGAELTIKVVRGGAVIEQPVIVGTRP